MSSTMSQSSSGGILGVKPVVTASGKTTRDAPLSFTARAVHSAAFSALLRT